MGNNVKDAMASQVKKLQASGSVTKAKAWWNGLSPMQKALAIGIITGLAWGGLAYVCTVGKASAVVHAGGVVTPGPAITSAQAFWNAVIAGSLAGGLATYVAHSKYSSVVPTVETAEDLEV